MSILGHFEQKFQEALLDHERTILLTLLVQQLSSMTFSELAELLASPLGARLGPVKVSTLFDELRSEPRRSPGRPPKSAYSEADLEAAILEVLHGATEPISRDEVGRRLGDHRGVLPALRRLVAKGAISTDGGPIFFKYAVSRSDPGPTEAPPIAATGTPTETEVETAILRELTNASAGLSPSVLRARLDYTSRQVQDGTKRLVDRRVIFRRGVGRATVYLLRPDQTP